MPTVTASFGDAVDGDGDGGDAADDRPDNRDRLADRGDERDDVEVRLAHEAETDRRERAHHAGEDQLRAQPRADLGDRLARGRREVRAFGLGDEARDVIEQRLGLDEQVEAQDQNRDEAEHAADDAPERDEHRADRVAAGSGRRVLHRFLQRHPARHQL